jgi:hypothetical protein
MPCEANSTSEKNPAIDVQLKATRPRIRLNIDFNLLLTGYIRKAPDRLNRELAVAQNGPEIVGWQP